MQRLSHLVALGALTVASLVAGLGAPRAVADVQLLSAQPAIAVPREAGRFDYMTVDGQYRRLLAAHTSSNDLLVVNMDTGEIERRVRTGAGHGVALDVKHGKIFVGTEDGIVDVVHRRYLVENDRISVPGAAGAVTFDPKNDMLYADHSDSGEVWVIDSRTNKLRGAIEIPKGPEYLEYDPVTDRVYQNVTSVNSVVVIDPQTNAVSGMWPIAPASDPRGLAIDGAGHRLFSAGSNGKLAVIDMNTGSVLQAIDIPPRVDQIAWDAGLKRLYCARGLGLLAVIGTTSVGFGRLGDVTIPRGAHTLAVDPKTHNVWVAYGGDSNDYVMKFMPPSPSPNPSLPPPAPTPSSTKM